MSKILIKPMNTSISQIHRDSQLWKVTKLIYSSKVWDASASLDYLLYIYTINTFY